MATLFWAFACRRFDKLTALSEACLSTGRSKGRQVGRLTVTQNLIAGVICLVWLASPASRVAGAPPPTDGKGSAVPSAGVEAITRPSQDVTLSFVRPGTIAKVLVKDGQVVAAGELLVQQDDAAERAQLAQLEAQAADETRIKAAEAQLAQKRVDYKRMKEMSSGGAATETELEHARLEEMIAELSLALSKFQRDQDGRKRDEMRLQLDRMRLTSPTAGRVERVFVETGESVDALKEVVRIVQIDPLWVDAPVPLATARTLKVGGSAQAAFGEGDPATTGRIIHIASIADAASGTLAVRVELANPAGRPAGEIVRLSFPRRPPRKAAPSGKRGPSPLKGEGGRAAAG